jgi:hypothetical protein
MTDVHTIHDGWLLTALGVAALAALIYQLLTGKAVMKGWTTPIKVFRRESAPWVYWPWVVFIGIAGFLLLGFGIYKVVCLHQ